MRQRQIQQATAAAERQALLAAPRIARGAGIVGRAAGLVGHAAAVAAAPETTAALALGGLAYGVGEDLLSNYGYGNSTKSMPQRQQTPLTDPTSRGTHRAPHRHIRDIQKKSEETPAPTAMPISDPPQQPEVQAVAVPVSPLPVSGRFQQSLVDLRGQSQPIHGFKIPRTRPYTLTAWERAARAKAQSVRGY